MHLKAADIHHQESALSIFTINDRSCGDLKRERDDNLSSPEELSAVEFLDLELDENLNTDNH